MNMKGLFIPVFLVTLLFASACDIVTDPLPNPLADVPCPECPQIDSAAIHTATRKVFVEEFTGHSCTGCPAQTDQLLALQEDLDPEMIVVSYHAGDFAEVDEDYPTEFRTGPGNELHQKVQGDILAYPSAMVNRETFEDFGDKYTFLAHNEWKDPINASAGATDPDIALGVAAIHDTKDNAFLVRVSAQALKDLTEEYRLVVLCLEDHVIAPQKDGRLKESEYPKKINKEYDHRHVMRDQVKSDVGINGDIIIPAAGAMTGEWIDWNHRYEIPSNVVNPDNCHIVAFVIRTSTSTIIQVEEAHVEAE